MFVSTNHFRCNSKIKFNDKGTFMVLSSERAKLPFLKWLVTPKGVPAYNFFKMTNKEKLVASSTVSIAVTPAHQKLTQLINNFFSFAAPSDFVEVNNNLLNTFLEKETADPDYDPVLLKDVVYMINCQSQFIVLLKEHLQTIKNK